MPIPKLLMFAMCAHVCWAALLYVALTVLRAPKVWGLGTRLGTLAAWSKLEPRVSANLSNQFEWSVFFYAGCLAAVLNGTANQTVTVLAWVFVLGRIIHTGVQVGTTNIRLRGLVFTINFLAVLALWFVLAASYV